jgi:PAS domain S-box-containing protein
MADRAVILERSVRDVISDVTRTAALLELDPSMTRDEFRIAVADTLRAHPYVLAFLWAPLTGDPPGAGRRPPPILYSEPLQDNGDTPAAGLLDPAPSVAAFTEAAARREVVFSGPIHTAGAAGEAAGVVGVAPVFASGAPVNDPRVAGFALVAFRSHDLLHELSLRAGGGGGRARAHFELVDETGPPDLLARSAGWKALPVAPGDWSHRIDVGSRRWRLSGQPTAVFFSEHASWQPIALGIGAFAFWESAGMLLLALMAVAQKRARREQDAMVRTAFNAIEQTADSIFITNSEGVIEYVNSGFELTTGYSREEALGRTPAILKSGMQDADYYATLWATITRGDVFRSKPINRRKNGEPFHAEQTITPIRDDGGRITHFVSVVKDVTERIRRTEYEVEMAYAARVQRRLYPSESPRLSGVDVAASIVPAAATGGDYVDYLHMPDGSLGIAVGDVSGHGLAAALIMAETRALLRPLTAVHANPAAVLEQLNPWLHRDLDGSPQFVTLTLACVAAGASRLVYASAGHEPGCVIAADGSVRAILDSTGVPLGLFPASGYGPARALPLAPGDSVVLLTDGVTEAEGAASEPFRLRRAIEVVRRHREEPAQDIARHVTEAARQFAGSASAADDVTIVVCKILPEGESRRAADYGTATSSTSNHHRGRNVIVTGTSAPGPVRG